jgi:hypothetical protein
LQFPAENTTGAERAGQAAESAYKYSSSSDGTKLVAVAGGFGSAGYIYTSADSGATWTQKGTKQNWMSVASSSDGTKLVAVDASLFVDQGGYIYTSSGPVQ